MLTKTGCEAYVIVAENTPALPGPGRLPYLTEVNNDKTTSKFIITHPFDERIKLFSSRDEAKMYLNSLRKKEFFTTPYIPDDDLQNCDVFKVEYNVEMCEKPSSRDSNNDLPVAFETVECKGTDGTGTSRTLKLPVNEFVPWIVTGNDMNPLCKLRRLIFLGSQQRFFETRVLNMHGESLSNSLYVDEEEYNRLLAIYKEFYKHPEKFLKKGGKLCQMILNLKLTIA